MTNPPPINPSAGDHATASSAAPSAQYRFQPSANTQPTRPRPTGPRVQLIRDVSPFNAYAEVIDICRFHRRPPIDGDYSNLHGQRRRRLAHKLDNDNTSKQVSRFANWLLHFGVGKWYFWHQTLFYQITLRRIWCARRKFSCCLIHYADRIRILLIMQAKGYYAKRTQ
jgi:hypothetical protein